MHTHNDLMVVIHYGTEALATATVCNISHAVNPYAVVHLTLNLKKVVLCRTMKTANISLFLHCCNYFSTILVFVEFTNLRYWFQSPLYRPNINLSIYSKFFIKSGMSLGGPAHCQTFRVGRKPDTVGQRGNNHNKSII